jgi:purine nucleoside permease
LRITRVLLSLQSICFALDIAILLLFVCLPTTCSAQIAKTTALIHPKVIVVAYFEVGRDTGDEPGELQFWVERDHLDLTMEVPGMSRPIRMNAEGSEIAMAVGPGNIRPAMNLMAFGFDPRFDLTHSYWLLNGIAGVSPKDAPLASAIWTDYVVNGDLLHEIDAREMPRDWPDGFYALNATRPGEENAHHGAEEDVAAWPNTGAHSNPNGSIVRLNPSLLNWAFDLTRDTQLPETDQMRSLEARYTGFPAAQKPPRVFVGANLAAETFWHGAKMDEWALAGCATPRKTRLVTCQRP